MENETLNKEQFNCVEVPDFLYDSIKEKIELHERKIKLQSRLIVAAAVITLFVNVGIISQYDSFQNSDEADALNPYSLNTLYD